MREFIPRKLSSPVGERLPEEEKERIDDFLEKSLNLDAADLQSLRERIQANNGLIRIFVHPFYEPISGGGKRDDAFAEVHDFVEKGALRHFDNSARAGTAPVLLFEEHQYVDDAKEKITKTDGKETDIFVIPTESGTGNIEPWFASHALHDLRQFPMMREETVTRLKEDTSYYGGVVRRTKDPISRKYASKMIKEFEEGLADESYIDTRVASDKFIKYLLQGLGATQMLLGGMYIEDKDSGLLGCLGPMVKAASDLRIKIAMSRYHTDWAGKDVKGNEQQT